VDHVLVEVVAADAENRCRLVRANGEARPECCLSGGAVPLRARLLGRLDTNHLELQLLRRRAWHEAASVADTSRMRIHATRGKIQTMTSGTLIREARLRAGLSQGELSERSGKDRAQIARWERDVVQPSFETLRELVRACGFDLETSMVPYETDEKQDARLQKSLLRSPQERLQAMLKARSR
jgi:transcriptional regulator with XRE-family HTH domain